MAAVATSSVFKLENFIGGNFVPCHRYIDSFEPATGKVLLQIPDSGSLEVDAAVAAASKAFLQWSSISIERRAEYLLKVADILEEQLEEFAVAESRDQGKPVWLARNLDIPRAVKNFRHFASTTPHILGTSKELAESNTLCYTTRSPIGVAGLISPWNLPLYLLTFKIAPALICGNTVVAKPSEMTSLTAYKLCKVFKDAGSTVTGRAIAQATAPYFKKLSLEMGGKNAAILFADCDLQAAYKCLIRSSFINQGQVGIFMLPTVITGLKDKTRCMQEEIFGPVTCITPFDTEEEVIERVNSTAFGLCASVWSTNNGTVHRVAEVGTVWTNCWLVRDIDLPFGGVKGSGIGREGTKDSFEFFTESKSICCNIE
ncbi:Aldehyde dehydrogenase family 8 member A1 [Armadillidium vulgare]|nr:Aldehyde dehydrogenase family 8 member A1 [Armadillidium vulgare]